MVPSWMNGGKMMTWLNVGSLVLGLIAWILPGINLMRVKDQDHKSWIVLMFLSISACAVSLCFQILYNNHLVNIEDILAWMYTTGAIAFVSVVLIVNY
jgi:hypothetical protein